MTTKEKILVLGYYDRGNLGDEQYKTTIPMLLKTNSIVQYWDSITFKSPEDIVQIPQETTMIIVGGGDVINDYFMTKIQKLTKNFVGRIYALSVGIPYSSGTKYLYLFDHIYARSRTDYEIAVSKIGVKNVSICMDSAFKINIIPNRKISPYTRIGVCFANSYFEDNPNKDILIDSLLDGLNSYYQNYNQYTIYHFIPFNTHSGKESDNIIHTTLYNKLTSLDVPCFNHTDFKDPIQVLNFMNNDIDIVLCMRFHSIIFSALTGKRFIALYTTTKIDNLLTDIDYSNLYSYKLDVDQKYRPTNIDSEYLLKLINSATYDNVIEVPYVDQSLYANIVRNVFVDKKQQNVLVHIKMNNFDTVLLSTKRALSKFLNISIEDAEKLLLKVGPFNTLSKTKLEIARLLCFIVTGQINHPTVWGFAENMSKNDFVLFDSIKYIWNLHKKNHDENELSQVYAPQTLVKRKTLFNVDYIFNNDFSQYHRSGWSYVVGGLLNFDASHLLRESDVLVDIYVDRSFHWGKDVLTYLGAIPYTKPWYGFIHHTFNLTHSNYNCHQLLKIPEFIESLKFCRGLIVLSKYLENQLRKELQKININIPIYTVYHPTEFVTDNFTIENFIKNKTKRIIQIGAWLRNPYSIYELPLPTKNILNVHKAVLKGKDMDNYFPSKDLDKDLKKVLLKSENSGTDENPMSRDNTISRDSMCRDYNVNKFNKGLYDSIVNNVMSVEIIDKLSNEDYDELLSKNIVFLNLIDCSAVNTVIECIVRNTPIIVNRHPALEELLGSNYPGFYSSLYEASQLIQSYYSIYKIYVYLTRLDKTRYKLDTFLSQVQEIIINNNIPDNPALFSENKNVKFNNIKKFLPSTDSKFKF